MRTIGVVTTSRADYGIYQPILQAIERDAELDLWLYVGGMHLSPAFGRTVEAVEADGYRIVERVELLVASDTPEAIAKSMGLGTLGFAQAYARSRPDLLVVLGDRFEMHAAALAALPFKIPVAHIHGGEVTEGAIDDALRHSMTKLSHLHFVSTETYARRVMQLGEAPERVTVVGAPGLDNLRTLELLSPAELEERFPLKMTPAPLIVTFHPVTLAFEDSERHITELLAAVEESGLPAVFTAPNADTGGGVIQRRIAEFVDGRANAWRVDNMGARGYFSLMQHARAMVGNSSSGIIEAPSFGLPVVNVGERQDGRVAARNVIRCDYDRKSVLVAIERAVGESFRGALEGLENPFGDGHAAERIVERLKAVELGSALLRKSFHDVEQR